MLKKRSIHYVSAGQGPCIRYGGQEMNVKLGAAQSNGDLTIIEDVIPPDSGPPLHIHQKEDESYYVLEGTFEFVCGQDHVNGGVGTFVFAPRGLPHRYKNIGKSIGRMLFSFTPGGIEDFFTELGAQPELNPAIMTEIARRHKITILPPAP
ncbi:MAG TPA: cupin domain-containing protein [Candidatus Baltobacteraceae bacterium]